MDPGMPSLAPGADQSRPPAAGTPTPHPMTIRPYTTAELDQLKLTPKRILNPRAQWADKPQARPVHRQRNFEVVEDSGDTGGEARAEARRFRIYQRQNLNDQHDFSCGILHVPRGGPPLTLARYNGPAHEHGDIAYRPHIHCAAEAAIAAGRKPESEATATDRFQCLDGALACLVDDFNVYGLNPKNSPIQLRLPI